ncbi:MAG: RES domain-containing protein [Candidatus Eremiobacteraeota bacterium]|nr:RES domain-containing protein [Candidatus Eremiobacteraeota bacterium]MBC5804999.1 RES domain-containing protein [Candidatus Eremiobacteraeota bacterium]MBC5820678.1 RES domain-containing protein [Candidatus Eremiobacteraeota bacterium]
MTLPLRRAPARLYRVHRSASPLELPSWTYASVATPTGEPNFGGRWDDPRPLPGKRFRTLSLSSDPAGALIEVFQDLRPDPAFRAIEAQVETSDAADEHGPSAIALDDIVTRKLSVVSVHKSARFAPVTESPWLSYLRDPLAPDLDQSGIAILKIGYLLVGDTKLSQGVAGVIFRHFPDVAGITSPSTMGTDFENFAIFERHSERGDLRAELRVVSTAQLHIGMTQLATAFEQLGLRLEGNRREVYRK